MHAPCSLHSSTITSAFSVSAPTRRWQRCNFDTLAIHAGSPHMLFLDDHPYPFKPNPHFKLWVPLEDAVDCWLVYRPGEKPRLIFLQPADYWHKPPSLPHGFWTHHFQIEVIREPGGSAPPSHAPGPLRIHRRMAAAVRGVGFRGEQPGSAAAPAALSARDQDRIRAGVHAPRVARRSARARGGRSCVPRGQVGVRNSHGVRARHGTLASASCPTPTSSRSTRTPSVLHYQHQEREAPAEHRSFLIDAGAQFHTYAADVTRTYAPPMATSPR